MSSQTEQIRALNDQLRQNLSTGLAVITPRRGRPRAGSSEPNRQNHLGL